MRGVRGLLVLASVLTACGGGGSGAYGGGATANASPTPAYPLSAGTEPPKSYGYGARPESSPAAAVTGELKIVDNAKLGKILAGSNGMTLYTFKRDTPNTSTCVDPCTKSWPPLVLISGRPVAPAGLNGTLGLATRPDGSMHATYSGMPLYFYAADQNPGDANGEGVGGVWFTVKNP